MTWWGWLLLGFYIVGDVICWRYMAWELAHEGISGQHEPEGDDVLFGVFFGGVAALVWPAVMFVRCGLAVRGGRLLMAEPPWKRHRREMAERNRRIAQLECELGIEDA